MDQNGVIIVGHVRLLAAQQLELTNVPVHVATELTPAQANAYRRADNRTNEEATWDMEALTFELANLKLVESMSGSQDLLWNPFTYDKGEAARIHRNVECTGMWIQTSEARVNRKLILER